MKPKVKKSFVDQVQRLADRAQDMIYRGEDGCFWGSTYVEGVSAALDWVLGSSEPNVNPLSFTSKRRLANEVSKSDLQGALRTIISAFAQSRGGDSRSLDHLVDNEKWFNHMCKLVGIRPEDMLKTH